MNQLKRQRFEMGMSQYDLEKATGINQSRISLIESGYRNPSQEQKIKLAKALVISVSELFPNGETIE